MADKKSNNQKELLLVAALAILLGLGGGYAIGMNASDSDESSHSHSETASEEAHSDETSKAIMHEHSTYPVPAENAPTVQLKVEEDAKSGYNIELITNNFIFTPEKVNGENVAGEGHAHLYVDGEKIGRVYGNHYHYSGTFEGTKTFKVTLNANDHSDYVIGDTPIEASVDVTHDSSDPNHSHDE